VSISYHSNISDFFILMLRFWGNERTFKFFMMNGHPSTKVFSRQEKLILLFLIAFEIYVHSGGRLKGSKLVVTNDAEKLEKIWIVMPKGSRMPKADQVLINCPVMMPAADFSINHKEFTQHCTARIEKMINFLIRIMPPAAAAPKLQQPKKRRVVNDYDNE
jgi:hypothetical protein